jgi:hypothetical protein
MQNHLGRGEKLLLSYIRGKDLDLEVVRDFKDLMAFGTFILALLTFVFTFIR